MSDFYNKVSCFICEYNYFIKNNYVCFCLQIVKEKLIIKIQFFKNSENLVDRIHELIGLYYVK